MPVKHPLQKAIEDGGFEPRSYSGRAMYGRRCLGVEIDRNQSIGNVVAAILESIADDDCRSNEQGLREIADGFRDMRWDNMGLDTIYYFPNVPFVSDDEEEDEEVA